MRNVHFACFHAYILLFRDIRIRRVVTPPGRIQGFAPRRRSPLYRRTRLIRAWHYLGGLKIMKILTNGINFSTRSPLIGPMEEKNFAGRILASLPRNTGQIRFLYRTVGRGAAFKEVTRERMPDPGDPVAAGWTYLVNANDPARPDIEDAVRPLAEHRGMKDPAAPLEFHDEPPDEWFEWMTSNYWADALQGKKVPSYILIIGGPEMVPFHFQALLDTTASVGRVDFDGSAADLKTYVEKVIRTEKNPEPVVERKAVVFAPDGGPEDATYYSHHFMAEPIAEHIRTKCGVPTQEIMGDAATKENLLSALSGSKAALVYSASHGIAAPDQPLAVQKRYNGAICCQAAENDPLQKWLLTAEDIPVGQPFLEGSIFFQFACYGYGTPAESDFMHWLGSPEFNSEADFVASLPKKLLSHPRGPVAYIGHLDTAWLHGFMDPSLPELKERWDPRIVTFVRAVELLLQVQPGGIAMSPTNDRYNVTNSVLSSVLDRMQRGKLDDTPEFQQKLSDIFITRSDAQNYMIFGDPAVRLRIPEE
jgi:hypothetical protein